jgi:hypothetical protein
VDCYSDLCEEVVYALKKIPLEAFQTAYYSVFVPLTFLTLSEDVNGHFFIDFSYYQYLFFFVFILMVIYKLILYLERRKDKFCFIIRLQSSWTEITPHQLFTTITQRFKPTHQFDYSKITGTN